MQELSPRERQVMELVCQGFTGQEIGERLAISSRTVEIHRRNAVNKIGGKNQTEAAVIFDRMTRAAPPALTMVEIWQSEWLNANGPHWGDAIEWATARKIARMLDGETP